MKSSKVGLEMCEVASESERRFSCLKQKSEKHKGMKRGLYLDKRDTFKLLHFSLFHTVSVKFMTLKSLLCFCPTLSSDSFTFLFPCSSVSLLFLEKM